MESLEEIIGRYRQAVEQNINQTEIIPPPDRVYVQSMPIIQRYGDLIIPFKRPEDIVDDLNTVMYGTVLAVGSEVTELSPGDDVFFSRKFGVKFGGIYNPLRLESKVARWEDMIRIFRVSQDRCEIYGKIVYELIGKTISFERPSGERFSGKVIDESVMYGGSIKVSVNGDDQWISPSWIIKEDSQ